MCHKNFACYYGKVAYSEKSLACEFYATSTLLRFAFNRWLCLPEKSQCYAKIKQTNGMQTKFFSVVTFFVFMQPKQKKKEYTEDIIIIVFMITFPKK